MTPLPPLSASRLQTRFPLAVSLLTGLFLAASLAHGAQDNDEEIDSEGECTGYFVTGMAGGGDCFLHKNRDSTSWREGVALVTPKEGYKYLIVQTDAGVEQYGYGMNAMSGINAKGVAGATFAGTSSEPKPKAPWSPSAACRHALQHSATSKEYVAKFGEVVKEHGIPGGISGTVSPREGWKIEYGGHRFATEGPYVDYYLPIANAYTIPSMRPYDTASWRRFGRLRKAREILERDLYPDAPGKPWLRSWDIIKAFDFARNEEPLESPIAGAPDAFGPGALPGGAAGGSDPRPICDGMPWGRPGRCVSAHVAVPDKQHPGHLSVLWWTLDRPNIAPFIPLFIGVTELPPAIDAKEGFAAADLFHELRLLVYEHTEYRDFVSSVWRKFETRQHRAVVDEVRAPVRAHLAAKREAEAQKILNDFLRAQVDEAMDTARKLVVKIKTESAASLLPDKK